MADALYFKVILHPIYDPPLPPQRRTTHRNEEKTVSQNPPKPGTITRKHTKKYPIPHQNLSISPHQTPESNRIQHYNKHRSHDDHMAPKNPRVTFYDEIA
jgi:hypothetical protein